SSSRRKSMRFRMLAVYSLFMGSAFAGLQAQQSDPRCSDPLIVGPTGSGGDACQKTLDIFNYMTPQFGALLTGGNSTLGLASATGGPGRFSISVRATAMQASIPNIEEVGVQTGSAQQSTYAVKDQPAGFPTADASIGVFGGVPVGVTRILSVDALGSLTYVPSLSASGVDMNVGKSFQFGYGARLGLVQESMVVPGISVSWIRRDLPSATLTGSQDDDTVTVSGFGIETSAWRIVAGKSVGMFGLALGYGKDTYKSDAQLSYVVNEGLVRNTPPNGPYSLSTKNSATNMFADVSLNLIAVKIVAEIGRVKADGGQTYNQFSKGANEPRLYGALGVRFGR
ncbi:MAG: hypothetical protein ABR543_12255, partial [Gemmatimonadaceae bacterium]